MGSKRNNFSVPQIMTFRPTFEEFKDFNKYVEYMESCGAHEAGLAKVIPPPEWKPRTGTYDMSEIGDLKIPAPISQILTGVGGIYQQINLQKKAMTVREYKELAESMKHCENRPPLIGDHEEVERAYWKRILYGEQIYGADVSGSLMDPDLKEWNINSLNSVLDYVSEDYKVNIEGVNTAYLYFGMWKTTFAWHTEDMDLYSINYLHFGDPKSWYAIPPRNGARFERFATGLFPDHFKNCKAFLRHKTSLISPSILKANSIPFNTITQEQGEFMITFPYSYHAGFNQGFNCAESTNFASKRWVEYGKRCSHCTCMSDSVKISMDVFVRRLQPDRYDLWLEGRDVGEHPEKPGRGPAPLPDRGMAKKGFSEKSKDKKASKRHPVHKRPSASSLEGAAPLGGAAPDSSTDSCDEDEILPDEQDLEYLEEIYIKSGELGSKHNIPDPRQASILDDGHGMRYDLPGAKKPRREDEAEWTPKGKKSPKKLKCRYPTKVLKNFPIQPVSSTSGGGSGGGRKPKLSATVFPSLSSPSRAAAGTTYFCNEAINRILGQDLAFVPQQTPQRVFAFNTTPPMWRFDNRLAPSASQSLPPTLSVSPDSTVSSTVQTVSPTKKEDNTPPVNMGIEVLKDLIVNTQEKNMERLFNSYWSESEPHCALCTSLCTRKSKWHEPMPDNWKEYKYTDSRPHSSEVWSPAYVFSRRVKEQGTQPCFDFGGSIEQSQLLTCADCRVCVHAFCYGETRTIQPGEPWRCDKCRVHMSEAACCLCSIPWGPLKRTSDRRWAHLLCSLLIYEVNFMDEDRKEPINVHNINNDRLNLRCSYCKGAGRGISVECCHPLCMVAFHPTCGLVCGARFSISKGPSAAYVLASCADHTPCPPKVANSVLKRPAIGETVWARHTNGRYYSGTVECVDEKIFAWIEYADGSFSNETEPQLVDIGPFCRERQLKSGLKVEVRSEAGTVYQGIYEGSSLAPVYTVRTESLLITGVRESDLIEFGKANVALKEEKEVPEEAQASSSTCVAAQH